MLCFRCLWLVPLTFTIAAGPVRAQQQGGAPSQRTVTFRFDCEMETEVADLYLAPGSATTVHMPGPIRKGGITLQGGQGRITAMQPPGTPNVLVLLAIGRTEPERIPLFVTTTDGKRYPFTLATLPGVMDSEVRVVSSRAEPRARPSVGAPIMTALVQGKEVAVRSFERRGDNGYSPWVEKAVRQDNQIFLRVYRRYQRKTDRPWEVQAAALVGVHGEQWKVVDVQWSREDQLDINVIQAELPEGASESYALTSIRLRGDDGVETVLDGKGVIP